MRVYADASVFGGVFDEEFAEPSRRFFDRVRQGALTLLVSPQVLRELSGAPQAVRDEFDTIPEVSLETVPMSSAVEALADAYLAAGVLGSGSDRQLELQAYRELRSYPQIRCGKRSPRLPAHRNTQPGGVGL